MVSIPDWSKFARAQEGLKDSRNVHLNKYYKQREEEAIRQAEERGYFRVPTQSYLLEENDFRNGRKVRELGQLHLVKLVGVHLRKIGDIAYCVNLRICILNNNFLTKIDDLASCRQLVKLDLHSNQISSIPGVAFWSGMRKLKIIHLHDNPLGKYETLQNLATCPSLMALTLYDTPLSLKRNYRHHVVNSIWSLKALDHHVISDEEIIEDAIFGGRFGTLHPAFRTDLCPPTLEDSDFQEEMYTIYLVEAYINHIQAHHSPVLIIQRFMRGYLTRKRFGHLGQKLNQLKQSSDLTMIPSELIPPPPSSSPAFGASSSGQDVSVPGMDYDTYMKDRRPDSSPGPPPSEGTGTSVAKPTTSESVDEPHPTLLEGQTPVQDDDVGTPKKRKNLLINLAKLQTGTFSSLYDEGIAVETVLPENSREKLVTASEKKSRRKKRKESQKKVVKSVKQFFGPIVESSPAAEESPREEEDDTQITEYRLRGIKPDVMYIDATTEMILSKQEAGRMVRDAEDEIHMRARDMPKPKITPRKSVNTNQRMFARVHGTMGISSLLAVHQAYRDREKAEQTAAKMEHILTMRDERDRAKERIRLHNDEKRNMALRKRDAERSQMLDILEKKEMKRLSYLEKRSDLKAKSSDLNRSHKTDFAFITEFSNQHTSVSNALMRHDKQARTEDNITLRTDLVQTHNTAKVEQQELVKKYMEHRQLMRQTEAAMARATLDTRMLQEANDRLFEAKSRVAQQKARRETVQTFYPLPQHVTPAPGASATEIPELPAVSPGATRFEANIIMNQGRVGKHPTLLT